MQFHAYSRKCIKEEEDHFETNETGQSSIFSTKLEYPRQFNGKFQQQKIINQLFDTGSYNWEKKDFQNVAV